MRARLPGGDKLADTAIGQEQEGKEVLDKPDKLDAGDTGFDKLVTKFIEAGMPSGVGSHVILPRLAAR